MNLPKELTTVTPLSKALALFMFILLPIVGFLLGMNYQNVLITSKTKQTVSDNLKNILKQTSKLTYISPTSVKNNNENQGKKLVTTDERTEFFFPIGSFSQKVILETTPIVNYLVPKGILRHAGIEAGVKLIQGNIENPQKPYTITMHYEDAGIKHLNETTLSIYYGAPNVYENPTYSKKLTTLLDKDKNIATAESQVFGVYGLLGELKCPNDIRETQDDNYKIHGGQDISFNTLTSDLFDLNEDVDWYFINTTAGKKYNVKITNTASGVVPIIELSNDGLSIKQDNKKNLESEIEVDLKLYSGYIQIKLSPKEGSKTGCDATYDLLVKEK